MFLYVGDSTRRKNILKNDKDKKKEGNRFSFKYYIIYYKNNYIASI